MREGLLFRHPLERRVSDHVWGTGIGEWHFGTTICAARARGTISFSRRTRNQTAQSFTYRALDQDAQVSSGPGRYGASCRGGSAKDVR